MAPGSTIQVYTAASKQFICVAVQLVKANCVHALPSTTLVQIRKKLQNSQRNLILCQVAVHKKGFSMSARNTNKQAPNQTVTV